MRKLLRQLWWFYDPRAFCEECGALGVRDDAGPAHRLRCDRHGTWDRRGLDERTFSRYP
jgi:hypothetical protein